MILAIDTATLHASLALYDERDASPGALRAESTWNAHRRHTQELVVEIDALLRRAGVPFACVDTLAVTTGPGSFTGVRVGISTVKGLVEGARLAGIDAAPDAAPNAAPNASAEAALNAAQREPRALGVPTLTVTAAPWLDLAFSISPAPVVCAFIQAGRGRYNWCFFGPEDLLYRPPAEAHGAGDGAELAATLANHGADAIWLVGELDAPLATAVRTLPRVTAMDATFGQRRAGTLARLAALLLAEGVDERAATLQPLYLHPPA